MDSRLRGNDSKGDSRGYDSSCSPYEPPVGGANAATYGFFTLNALLKLPLGLS